MSKKRNQRKAQAAGASTRTRASRRSSRRRLNWPSLIFIGLLLLAAATIAIASMFGGDRPDCPPGQVWSESHGHCH